MQLFSVTPSGVSLIPVLFREVHNMCIYKRLHAAMIGLFMALLLSACSTVTITKPLSENSKLVDKEKFEGLWLVDDEAITVKFTDDGIARFATLDWKSGEFTLLEGELAIAEGTTNGHGYMSVRLKDKNTWENEYHLIKYKLTDKNILTIWSPNFDAFEEAIKTHKLKGVIRKLEYGANITVTNTPDHLVDIMNSPEHGDLFKDANPTTFRRTSADKK